MGGRRKGFLSLASLVFVEPGEGGWSREGREGRGEDHRIPKCGRLGACCSPFPFSPSEGALVQSPGRRPPAQASDALAALPLRQYGGLAVS